MNIWTCAIDFNKCEKQQQKTQFAALNERGRRVGKGRKRQTCNWKEKSHLPSQATSPWRWVAQQPALPFPGSINTVFQSPIAMTVSFYASYGLTCQTHQCKKLALLIYIWTLSLSWEKPVPREQLAQGHGNKTLVMGHSRWPTNSGRHIQNMLSTLVWFAPFSMQSKSAGGPGHKAVLS